MEGLEEENKAEPSPRMDMARISWNDVERMWFQTIPGEEKAKNRGIESLRRSWRERFRTDAVWEAHGGDRIPLVAFQSLAREHVVDVLSRKAGLQLRAVTSSDRRYLYYLIRAPMRLLERKADAIHYKLQFRPEVDPGRDFWMRQYAEGSSETPVYAELVEEAREIDKTEASERLENLYTAGKISSNDMAVLDEFEPTKKHWSRRIHTLERVADKVPCTNCWPAFAEYSTDSHLRHLFKEYPTPRGFTSLFLPKDRIYLTKRVMDQYFDFGVLVEKEIVVGITALHDANLGERVDRDWLLQHWVFWWRADPATTGSPRVTHLYVEDTGSLCPRYLRPWAQPLMEIRNYFGEKIAFYFAWLGFYGLSLVVPALAGGACLLYDAVLGTGDEERGVHPEQLFLAVLLVGWVAYYKDAWDVEEQWCALKWGTADYAEVEADRPQFYGDPDDPLRLSPITNKMETYYPDEKRSLTRFASTLVVFSCVVVLVAAIVVVFAVEFALAARGLRVLASLSSVLVFALAIPAASASYFALAVSLNDLENYRTQTDYENNLVLKKFFFEVFNNYAALLITAFLKGPYLECDSGHNNCLKDVQILLLAIFSVRFAFAFAAVFDFRRSGDGEFLTWPQTSNDVESPLTSREEDSTFGGNQSPADLELDKHEEHLALQNLGTPRFVAELELDPYQGTFDDYTEICLQMGLVSMFSLGLYLAPFFALLEVLLQLRIDAFKLCAQTRRPDAVPAESVGRWGDLMATMGLVAVFVNAGIIIFTTRSFERYSLLQRLLGFFVVEHCLLAVKVLTHVAVPDTPSDLVAVRKRQKVVVDRHKHVADFGQAALDSLYDANTLLSNDDNPNGTLALRKFLGTKRGNIDRDSVNATRLQEGRSSDGAHLDDEAKFRLRWLRSRLGDVATDIKIARQSYRNVCRTEVFRDDLGVSYSRKQPDLALGLVNLTVLEAENVGNRYLPAEAKNCRVIVHVRDSAPAKDRRYQPPVGPGPVISKVARKPIIPPTAHAHDKQAVAHGGRLVFNQTFTLAPIKSAKAEIYLEIVDHAKRERRATAALPLADLVDQQSHSKTLLLTRSTAALTSGSCTLPIRLPPRRPPRRGRRPLHQSPLPILPHLATQTAHLLSPGRRVRVYPRVAPGPMLALGASSSATS